MIKILHVIYSASFGGIEQLVYQTINAQIKDPSINVAILILNKKGEFLSKYEHLDIQVHDGKLNSGFDFSPSKLLELKKIMQSYDLIHYHVFNPSAALMGIMSNKKLFYTEHGNFGLGRKLSHFQKIAHKLKKYFLNNFIHFISFNSNFTLNYARNMYNLNGVNMRRVYNGVDILDRIAIQPTTKYDTLKVSNETFIVGTSSRFAGFKRIDRLIHGFAKFALNKNNVKLLLVGDGILKKGLVQLVQDNGITDKTIFTGFQSDVLKYQSCMDVCVFSSKEEPFGLVAIETLALGKPTIVYADGGGLVEIISQVNKLDIVESNQNLATRLEHYYDIEQDSSQLVLKRKEVANCFSLEKMNNEFKNIYLQLITDVRN